MSLLHAEFQTLKRTIPPSLASGRRSISITAARSCIIAALRPPAHSLAEAAHGAAAPRNSLAARWRRGDLLALAALALLVAVALADGLLSRAVAYERDTTHFYFPVAQWAAGELRAGRFPLWSPGMFGGYPLFADGEPGLANPFVLLVYGLLPAMEGFLVLRGLHLFVAGVGAYLLARSWAVTRPGALLTGLTFAFGSFLSAQVHHENIVRTAAWLPWVLATGEFALRTAGPRRGRWVAASALTMGLAGVGLHLQILAIDLLVVALYATSRWCLGYIQGAGAGVLSRLAGVLQTFGLAVLLGLLLASVQLLPLAELARFSPRGEGLPYAESAAYSLTPFNALQIVFPFFFRDRGNEEWGLWTHWESYLYVGIVPLVLSLAALLRPRERTPVILWALIGSAGLLLALGQYSAVNFHYALTLLPGMSGLRAPGRFTLMVVLAMAMLAGHGLAWLSAGARSAEGRRHLRGIGIAALLAVCLLASGLTLLRVSLLADPESARASIRATYLALPRDTHPRSSSDVLEGLADSTDLTRPPMAAGLALLAAAGLVCLGWSARPSRGWPMALITLAAIDLLLFAWQIHPRAPLARLADPGNAGRAVASLVAGAKEDEQGRSRVLVSSALDQLAPNRLLGAGISQADGYSSLESRWHRDYVRRGRWLDDGLLDAWNVRFRVEPTRYGTLASYGEVEFLPTQALFYAASRSGLARQRFTLPEGGDVVEVRIVATLADGVGVPDGSPLAEVTLLDAGGTAVASNQLLAGRDVMEWAYDHPDLQPRIGHGRVESAGVLFEQGQTRLLSFARLAFGAGVPANFIELSPAQARGDVTIYGVAVVDPDGTARQLFGLTQSKYREVYRGQNVSISENLSAFGSAYFVPGARVAPLGQSLHAMTRQPFDPAREVVIASETAALLSASPSPPSDEDSQAAVRVAAYSASSARVEVRTERQGFLVLSDQYYPGWRAWLDGDERPILRANLLFRAVEVPAGEHVVEMAFEPASVRQGGMLSLVALLACGLLLAWPRVGRARAA